MDISNFPVCVLGAGHLAAAVRTQLRLAGAPAVGGCESRISCPPLFLACSDFENAAHRVELARRARADGASVLFASLSGQRVRVGPLFTTHVKKLSLPSYLTRSWDFSLSDSLFTSARRRDVLSPYVDIGVTRVAQIGATLVVGELAKICAGGEGTADEERVAEIDSPFREGEWEFPTQPFGSRCDETFVAGGVRWRVVRRLRQVWLPVGMS